MGEPEDDLLLVPQAPPWQARAPRGRRCKRSASRRKNLQGILSRGIWGCSARAFSPIILGRQPTTSAHFIMGVEVGLGNARDESSKATKYDFTKVSKFQTLLTFMKRECVLPICWLAHRC